MVGFFFPCVFCGVFILLGRGVGLGGWSGLIWDMGLLW